MRVREHQWNAKTSLKLRAAFKGVPFVSCDPDANGAVALHVGGEIVGVKSIADPLFWNWLEVSVTHRWSGARVVAVVETQFVGVNMRATVTMARRAGYVVGALAMCSRAGVEVVNVVPSSWQYPTAKFFGVQGKLKRGAAKTMSMTGYGDLCSSVVPGWHGHTKEQQQGLADTIGIGRWWRNVCEGIWR